MCGKEKKGSKNIFGDTVFQPAETKGFGEKNMLQITHITGRKKKDIIIEPEEVMFFNLEWFVTGNFFEDFIDRGYAVDFGNNIEGASGIEDKGRG